MAKYQIKLPLISIASVAHVRKSRFLPQVASNLRRTFFSIPLLPGVRVELTHLEKDQYVSVITNIPFIPVSQHPQNTLIIVVVSSIHHSGSTSADMDYIVYIKILITNEQ